MPKLYLSLKERQEAAVERRMDRFDSVVTEYLRSSNTTAGELAFYVGIDVSTLWRWRNKPESFRKAPFITVADILRLAKCTNENLRYICGW